MTEKPQENITADDSDWYSITSSTLAESLPEFYETRASDRITKTHHAYMDNIKGIAFKITKHISTTFKTIAFEHVHYILKLIMIEVDKIKKISGQEKKEIVKLIMIYVLDIHGINHTVSYYTIELIDNLIELIYTHDHKKNKNCCCF